MLFSVSTFFISNINEILLLSISLHEKQHIIIRNKKKNLKAFYNNLEFNEILQFNKPDIGQFSFASFAHSKNLSSVISDILAFSDKSIDSTTPSTNVKTESVSKESGENPFSIYTKLNFILKQLA